MSNPDCASDEAARTLIMHPKAYALLRWEMSEREKWRGRDRRRIKRQQRKYIEVVTKVARLGALSARMPTHFEVKWTEP